MSSKEVNGSNGVNNGLDVEYVDGNNVWVSDGVRFTAGLEPFPDEMFDDVDFSLCKVIVGRYQNTKEFLVDYFVHNKPLGEKFQEVF